MCVLCVVQSQASSSQKMGVGNMKEQALDLVSFGLWDMLSVWVYAIAIAMFIVILLVEMGVLTFRLRRQETLTSALVLWGKHRRYKTKAELAVEIVPVENIVEAQHDMALEFVPPPRQVEPLTPAQQTALAKNFTDDEFPQGETILADMYGMKIGALNILKEISSNNESALSTSVRVLLDTLDTHDVAKIWGRGAKVIRGLTMQDIITAGKVSHTEVMRVGIVDIIDSHIAALTMAKDSGGIDAIRRLKNMIDEMDNIGILARGKLVT